MAYEPILKAALLEYKPRSAASCRGLTVIFIELSGFQACSCVYYYAPGVFGRYIDQTHWYVIVLFFRNDAKFSG